MKLLVSTFGFWGHALPTSAFVKRAIQAGHEVIWHTPEARRDLVISTGCTWRPFERTPKLDKQPPSNLETWISLAMEAGVGQSIDIKAIVMQSRPDIIIADSSCFGAKTAAGSLSIPFVELGMLPIVMPDPKVPLILQGCFSNCERPWPQNTNIYFCGPLLPDPAPWTPPKWWRTLNRTKPIIFVTQGTMAGQRPTLINTALRALKGHNVEVIVAADPATLDKSADRDNYHFADWFSLPDLLPRCAAMLTNGGYGTVSAAWAYGVPIVVAGETEEKFITGNRVDVVSGTGIDLKTGTPTLTAIVEALYAVINYPRFFATCKQMANIASQHDGAAYAVRVLEKFYENL